MSTITAQIIDDAETISMGIKSRYGLLTANAVSQETMRVMPPKLPRSFLLTEEENTATNRLQSTLETLVCSTSTTSAWRGKLKSIPATAITDCRLLANRFLPHSTKHALRARHHDFPEADTTDYLKRRDGLAELVRACSAGLTKHYPDGDLLTDELQKHLVETTIQVLSDLEELHDEAGKAESASSLAESTSVEKAARSLRAYGDLCLVLADAARAP